MVRGSGRTDSAPLAVAGLVAVNLVPLVGVVAFGWSLHALLIIYWVESGVVGALNLPRILLACGRGDGGSTMTATVNGRQVDLSGPDRDDVREGLHVYAANVPIAGFFLMHYGIFWVVHGVFVVFALPGFAGGSLGGVDVAAVLVGAVGMAVSHTGSFLVNFVGREEYRGISPGKQMSEPYRRVFVLHLTIVLGAFVVASVGTPLALLVLLVLLKTGADLVAHLREHRRAARRRAAVEANPTAPARRGGSEVPEP